MRALCTLAVAGAEAFKVSAYIAPATTHASALPQRVGTSGGNRSSPFALFEGRRSPKPRSKQRELGKALPARSLSTPLGPNTMLPPLQVPSCFC